jgi:suppressor of fused-like protein
LGLFDKLLGRAKAAPPPAEALGAPGWEAIDAALARLYPGQEARHLANPGIRWMHDLSGKANPLDGVHVFDAGTFWHFVGLGFSELYGKDSDDPAVSGLGYEFTFRFVKQPEHALPPIWPVNVMNQLGRPASTYAGIIFDEDPGLPAIETAHGRLRFLQLVAVDAATLARAGGGNPHVVLAELAARDPALVTGAS